MILLIDLKYLYKKFNKLCLNKLKAKNKKILTPIVIAILGFENTMNPKIPSTRATMTLAKVKPGKCSHGLGFQSGPTYLNIIAARMRHIIEIIYVFINFKFNENS